jgi:hypothetical protein
LPVFKLLYLFNYELHTISIFTFFVPNYLRNALTKWRKNFVNHPDYTFLECGIVVVEALCYKLEGIGFETR